MSPDDPILDEAALIDSVPVTPAGEEPKDLGFGSIVGRANERRLIERNGRFTSRREGFPPLSYLNMYHAMLSLTWPRFLSVATLMYVGMNAFFALLFLACGPDALGGMSAESMGGRFLRALFFSVETFATIGYGNVYPVGPASNWVMTIESIVSIFAIALLTGLVFARFARPVAALLFSDLAVVAPYHGKTGFMFRITNARSNQLMELEAKVQFTRLDDSGRRYTQLKLERTKVVFFPLSWTIVHPIDESSPLWGVSEDQLLAMDAEVLILLSGYDETFAQQVHTRSSYKASEIVWNARFKNIFDAKSTEGDVALEVSRVHEYELLDVPM